MMLRVMLDAASKKDGACGPLPDIEAAWDALITMQNRAPSEFDEILMQPQVGMWLAHCLRRLNRTGGERIPLWVDVGYVFNLVLAVAARAGIEFATRVPHRGGAVMIPALGMARLAAGADCGIAEAHVSGGCIRVRTARQVVEVRLPAQSDAKQWWALRRLRAQAGEAELAIWLDDIDPYRELGEPIPPDRLSNDQVLKWQQLLRDAYAILARDNPPLAATMAAAYASVVPLPAVEALPVRSASSGDCLGSALISMPPDPVLLAVTLVHEFQHIKLGGLQHMIALCNDDDTLRFYAPWRDDPRPLGGMLQGVYAFLGVTEFWRRRRQSGCGSAERDLGEFEFALWRAQTWQALLELRADAGLTSAGRRFAAGMVARMKTWWPEQVDPRMAAAARTAANEHLIGWRIRHMRPDPGCVARLVSDLSHGRESGVMSSSASRVVPDPSAPWSHQRVALHRLRFADPAEFGRRKATGDGGRPTLLTADIALVAGDHRRAAETYAGLLNIDPGQPDAWTGLVLARAALGGGEGRLLRHPEMLPAIHRELRADPARPGPLAIANWLCGTPR